MNVNIGGVGLVNAADEAAPDVSTDVAPNAAPDAAPEVAPGATLGVMGGGQLARMFVHAAQRLGYATAVLDADASSPAGRVSHHHIESAYVDAQGLERMARLCDAVTTEFENVPSSSLEWLARRRPVSPSARAVAICQDRVAEKSHFGRSGVRCAPYAVIDTLQSVDAADADLFPGVLKTARLGYDGKGQVRVADRARLAAAWSELGGVVCVLEQMLPLQHEISVVLARGASGAIVNLPVQHNLHRDGILAVTQVPAAEVPAEVQQHAVDSAGAIARGLDYVGVLCVEFFVLRDGSLVANEMAPRPHNSGHYSIDGCDVSQFDLQVRTMAGLPLVAPRLHSACVMLNLLGDLWFGRPLPADPGRLPTAPSAAADIAPAAAGAADRTGAGPATRTATRTGAFVGTGSSPGAGIGAEEGSRPALAPPWHNVLSLPGVHLHLYGKGEARIGRKMGHLTVTAATAEAADAVAREAARRLGIAAW